MVRKMSQMLILPINSMKITANYQNVKYLTQFGFPHYGIDAISTDGITYVYALGDGEVAAAGPDASVLTGPASRLGNCIVIVYRDVYCNDGYTRNLACRMFHFGSLLCKAGDEVKAGDPIGKYGSTGAYVTGAHLHIEFDSDINFPQYAVGIAQSGNVIKKGTINSTINPSSIWFIGDNQKVTGSGDGWSSDYDINIPSISHGECLNASVERAALKERVSYLEDKLNRIKILTEI